MGTTTAAQTDVLSSARPAVTAPGEARPTYIDSLTPLRGIAAVWVVVYHFDENIFRLVAPTTTGLLTKGYLWVDFFFLLSGFIICHVYGSRLMGEGRREQLWPYVKARFARLYPLHLFTLLLMIVLWYAALAADPTLASSIPEGLSMSPSAIPVHVLMLHAHGLTRDLSWNMPSWSIAAEWWTYLLAILLVPVLHLRGASRAWIAMLVGCIGLAIMEQVYPTRDLDITFDYGWLRCLLGFAAGMGVYQLYRAGSGARLLRTDGAFLGVSLLTVLLLHASPVDAVLIPAFILLLLAAAHNDGAAKRVLSTRPMLFLGDTSYSIYMVQIVCLFLVWAGILSLAPLDASGNYDAPYPIRLAVLALTMALTLGMAALTYRFVEVPAREWLRRRDRTVTARAPGLPPRAT